ncbi:MAG: peptide deformylase [Fimbriimonadaceae bacterium]|nr:peptide deformylase [Fimbriimonadaceae bacterium]
MQVVVPEEFKYLYVTDASRPIVKVPVKVLRQKCEPVKKVDKKTNELIDRMLKAMKDANGIGLAAPQLGIPLRVIVVAVGKMKPLALINPVITSAAGEEIGEEGCLSIPGLYGEVKRAATVEVEGYDRKGRRVGFEMNELAARVVQHEVDHLDGVLFIDKVDEATLHWMHPKSGDEAE